MRRAITLLMAAIACFSMTAVATTVANRSVKCGNCGTNITVQEVRSTSSFGPMELDTRPAPPARDLVYHVLQCCTNCGYCAFDVSRPAPTERMRKALRTGSVPQTLDERYLWAATLASFEGSNKWNCVAYLLRAAWVADDLRTKQGAEKAVSYRNLAIRYLREHVGQKNDVPPDHFLLLADLLRRARKFEESQKTLEALANRLTKDKQGEFLMRLVNQEAELCRAKVSSAQSMRVK